MIQSIRMSRIILPVLLGIAVVVYMAWKQFDPEEFAKIRWTGHVWEWLLVGLGLAVFRHLAYAWRLRVLSNKEFSWLKCIELVFIWEFSSAISPTAVGGSAVAFFVMAQERVAVGRTAAIVLYTIVLDTLFFVVTMPILYLIFGSGMIRPEGGEMSGWHLTFWIAYGAMFAYGLVFYYGLFGSPQRTKRFLFWITNRRLLRRFRRSMIQLGNDMYTASMEMRKKRGGYHSEAILSTFLAWISRFLMINVLVIAFGTAISLNLWDQFALYARAQSLFMVIIFSPTPGGAGLIEVLFGGFLKDYISGATSLLVVSFVWRILSYYVYLLAGAIVVPNWLRRVISERRKRRLEHES